MWSDESLALYSHFFLSHIWHKTGLFFIGWACDEGSEHVGCVCQDWRILQPLDWEGPSHRAREVGLLVILFGEKLVFGFVFKMMGLVFLLQRMSWGTEGGSIGITLCSFKVWRFSRDSRDSCNFDITVWQGVCCSIYWVKEQLWSPSSGMYLIWDSAIFVMSNIVAFPVFCFAC